MARPMLPLEELRRAFLTTGADPEDADRVFDAEGFNCGRLTRRVEDSGMVFDSIGTCVLYPLIDTPLQVEMLAELFSAATGMEISAGEMKTAGERGNNLHKVLNVREGFARQDDAPPKVWFQPKSTPDGDFVLMDYYGRKQLGEKDLEGMLDDYYDERGWDPKEGKPTSERLRALGLET